MSEDNQATITPPDPVRNPGDVWQEAAEDEFYFMDADGSEIGPYATSLSAMRHCDKAFGRRPLASEALERIIISATALTNHIAELEEQLSNAKAHRKYLLEHEIVETLDEEDRLSGVRLRDGTQYTFEDDLKVTILAGDRERAYAWFIANGLGGMLRRECILSFGKESGPRAEYVQEMVAQLLPEYEISVRRGKVPERIVLSVTEMLKAAGLIPAVDVKNGYELPGATLRSWVVKTLKQGVPLPDFVQVYAPTDPKLMVDLPDVQPDPGSIDL